MMLMIVVIFLNFAASVGIGDCVSVSEVFARIIGYVQIMR
jgi:hypothetical protein